MLSANTIHQTINEYNKYHAPEVTAHLSECDQLSCCILFTGSFCHTCGFYDYFDDFGFLLEDHGIRTTISEITETDTGAYVSFQQSVAMKNVEQT